VEVANMAEEVYEKFASYDWDKDKTFLVIYFPAVHQSLPDFGDWTSHIPRATEYIRRLPTNTIGGVKVQILLLFKVFSVFYVTLFTTQTIWSD
jgi:hypothetical protein